MGLENRKLVVKALSVYNCLSFSLRDMTAAEVAGLLADTWRPVWSGQPMTPNEVHEAAALLCDRKLIVRDGLVLRIPVRDPRGRGRPVDRTTDLEDLRCP